ncbi:MAG: hypothetical protein KDJ26_04045 [Alphaproteobacteria bacterium]|nr:hypothetical protein [Alphaproteobacteria bacterium]MCB1551154.1 hypothetical protein [Alphaproteobacteria bacterium]MCB9985380.1 hypothetical protein [Micavibrio sp.]HRK98158.1 hypothetical protein [Alphaproteobacteria bacterium]
MRLTGFILIFILLLGISIPVYADDWCKNVQSPQINVKTSTDNISYDFSKSEKELNGFSVDTVNPYGHDVITDVGGLMRGGISLSQSMSYGTLTNSLSKEICYWYTNINVTLHIFPTIYVANEFPKGTCKHNAILAHEHRHVIIDREIVNKYALVVGQALKEEMRRGHVYGPVPLSRQAELEKQLKKQMQAILTKYSEIINEERRSRQQALDNLQEYENVNTLCRSGKN